MIDLDDLDEQEVIDVFQSLRDSVIAGMLQGNDDRTFKPLINPDIYFPAKPQKTHSTPNPK